MAGEQTREELLEELAAARHRITELESMLPGAAASQHQGMLAALLDTVPDYVYFKDDRRRFVLASKLFCNLFGRRLDEILGKTDEELFPPEVAAETSRDDLQVIRTGTPIISKEEGGDALGWVLTTKMPWRDADGTVIGLVGISRDITARKREEEARRKADEHYRQLVENSPTVAWLTDARGATSFISSNVESVYGYSPGEIHAGGDALWLGRIHAEDRPRVQTAFAALFEQRTPFDVEYRIQRKDGEWIWLHDRANAVVQEEGELRAYGVFTDVTERKRAEQERRELEARLHQAQRLESLGVLASGIAHDFNNLLLAIYGNLDLALSDLDADNTARDFIGEAKLAATRAASWSARCWPTQAREARRARRSTWARWSGRWRACSTAQPPAR